LAFDKLLERTTGLAKGYSRPWWLPTVGPQGPVIVSEKTLETNILGELLPSIRKIPGCKSAFWVGMKQTQEARNGIDDLILNVPRGLHLALQFKAARPHPKDGVTHFQFRTSELQHTHLLRLSRSRPHSVLYVLPQVNTFKALATIAQNLLGSTYWCRVEDLRFLDPGSHRIWTNPVDTVVESEFSRVERLDSEDLIRGLRQDLGAAQSLIDLDLDQDQRLSINRSAFLSNEELRQWLIELFEDANYDPRSIGQRLRGFSTVCMVPD
jgi:hypothetical protein